MSWQDKAILTVLIVGIVMSLALMRLAVRLAL